MSEVRIKPVKPLPEPLPEGERVLWQGSPDWGAFSRRVFQVDKIAVYFLAIVLWVAISAYRGGGGWTAVLQSLTWAVPPALGVMILFGLIAWLYARSTVFTITSRRVVIESGLALPAAVNLPFTKIDKADMKTFKDGSGDIELSMSGPRLLYSMLWPNLRLLRLNRPTPVLRGVQHPQKVAEILGKALLADQESGDRQTQEAPAEEQRTARAASQ